MKSKPPPSAARRRLDDANRVGRARAAQLDKVAAGAGDVLRDAMAAAIRTAIDRHEQTLTGSAVPRSARND